MKQTFLFTVIACLFTAQSWAAPAISSVSGIMGHSQSVTITGSGFGTKSSAAPFLWDTVDNISVYSGVSNGQTIPTGGSYPWPGNYNDALKMETADTMRHANSSKMYKSVNNLKGAFLEKNLPTNPSTGLIYVSWWWKPYTSPVGGNHSSKFLSLSDQSDIPGKTFSWTQMHNYVYINGCGPGYWKDWSGNVNQWNFHEAIMITSQKKYYLYVNGSLLTNADWSECSGSISYNQVNAIGWDGGGSYPPQLTTWMDDIYVDNTLARVMIGNASTLAASTHREMQIPSEWSDSSIRVKVNQGSFAIGDTPYLYVVDENGVMNSSGYPITIQSATPPSAPKGLRIVN